jgi:hypothetical protein
MFLFYIDESGTGLKSQESKYFILASICIHVDDWANFYDQINSFKQQLISWAKPEDWELKGRHLRRGEEFFKSFAWEKRIQIFSDLSSFLFELPCEIFAVGVNKHALTEYVKTDEALYRLGFSKLLENLNQFLIEQELRGMLMLDARSDLHSSVQDRRLLDVYRDWRSASQKSRFIEMPWFGFSSFYVGLQLADYVAYSIEYMAGNKEKTERSTDLQQAFNVLQQKVRYAEIP